MLFARKLLSRRFGRHCQWIYSSQLHYHYSICHVTPIIHSSSSKHASRSLVFGFRDFASFVPTSLRQLNQEIIDPFSLVADELSILANRLRSMVVAEVPKLASAVEYFFKRGVEGKRFRPAIMLLMATALKEPMHGQPLDSEVSAIMTDLRSRQQCIAAITEMIHVASLLHDDVLDDADTRRGIGSLNFVMGNKFAVLAGNFLLSRACVALASLNNDEVVTLVATAVKHLVTGETMQMTTSSDQRSSMEYYMQKTYYKTGSLISNSCKAISVLAGQTAEVSVLAYDYGKNLGLAFQLIDDVLDYTGTSALLGKGSLSDIRHGIITAPMLFAMEEYPELRAVINKGFDNPDNVDLVLPNLDQMGRGLIWATAEDMARNRDKVLSLYRQVLRSLNSPDLPLNYASRLAKKAEARAIFMVGSEETSIHNIEDLIDTAEYALSVLRKGEIPKHIQ